MIHNGSIFGLSLAVSLTLTMTAASGTAPKAGISSPPFVRLSLTDGLSQANVHAIHQDHRGFLWFGTADGLNRFDGFGFTVIRQNPRAGLSLSENGISTLCEDSSGGLWIGTLATGLNRLDISTGVIQPYTQLLPDNRVRALCTDHLGRVWVGMQRGGLSVYDPPTNELTSFAVDATNNHSLPSNIVRALQPDESGLWIGTDGGGLCRLLWADLDRREFRFRRARELDIEGSFLSRTTEIARDREGRIWVGTADKGLAVIDLKGTGSPIVRRFVSEPANRASITGDVVYSIAQDSTGNVWVGTWEGLNKLEQDASSESGFRITRVLYDPIDPDSPPGNSIYSLLCDGRGMLWVGTNGAGLARFNASPQRFLLYKHDPRRTKTFPPGPVRAIAADDDGFWVGTTGGGLARVSDRAGVVHLYTSVPGKTASLSSNDVRTVLVDKGGSVWAGTYGGGLNRLTRGADGGRWKVTRIDTSALGSAQLFAMLQDRSLNYWVATQSGVVRFLALDPTGRIPQSLTAFRFKGGAPGGLSHPIVRMLFEDSRGCIWAGTYGGLDRICPDSDSIVSFRPDSLRAGSIGHRVVVSAAEDDDGYIWFGTFGGGLNRYDPRTQTFEVLDETHGLPNAYVYAILPDGDGFLWLSTNRGITRFNRRQWGPDMPADSAHLLLREFDVRDGLQSNEFNAGACEIGPDGTLFFGGIAGLNRFNPREVRDSEFAPAVAVTGFSLSGRPFNLDSATASSGVLTLRHDQNHFSIEVASLDFANPVRNKYAFNLEGLDKEWIPSGPTRRALYTNVDHGSYVFRARGTNSDEIWSPRELAIAIVIDPPFWHAWWFRATGLALLGGAGAMVVRYRMRNADRARRAERRFLRQLIESQENERKRIAGELHDGLGQHLLIIKNRALLGMDPSADPREQLREISDLAGQTINDVRGIAYGLRPYQLDRLGLTKAIEAICREATQSSRMSLVQTITNIDGLLPADMEINLYRIVQEAVTNMIKHSGATEGKMTLALNESRIRLEISDNGSGFVAVDIATRSNGGLGLSGIRERARILGGEAEVRSTPGGGTTITATIPVGRKES